MWIWLHNENGYPHPKAFSSKQVGELGRVLGISKSAIAKAIDASRHVYTARERPAPHATLDAFENFIDIVEHDRRQTVSRSYVLNLAKRLYAGAARK
jgi:hypothetical protein